MIDTAIAIGISLGAFAIGIISGHAAGYTAGFKSAMREARAKIRAIGEPDKDEKRKKLGRAAVAAHIYTQHMNG